MMEIESLKCFVVLSDKKKFTEAAYECNMSQSTLSKKIKKMENELGVQLFNRTMHETVLTVEGEKFYKYAKSILMMYDRALVELKPNTIRLGCMSVLSPYHIPKMLRDFSLSHQHLEFHIKESNARYAIDHIDDFDFILIRTDLLENLTDYVICPLIDDELCVVVSTLNSLSKQSEIYLSDIKDEAFIFPEKGSGGYEIFYDACKQAGFEPNIAVEMPHTSTMFSFVEENVGISLSFKKVYQEFENPKLKMISLKDDLHYPIALVYKKGKILHPIKKEFIEYCKEYF